MKKPKSGIISWKLESQEIHKIQIKIKQIFQDRKTDKRQFACKE